MCVPTGLAYLAGGIFISVGCWAVLHKKTYPKGGEGLNI